GHSEGLSVDAAEEGGEGDKEEVEEAVDEGHKEAQEEHHGVEDEHLERTGERDAPLGLHVARDFKYGVQVLVAGFLAHAGSLSVENDNGASLGAEEDEANYASDTRDHGEDPEYPAPIDVFHDKA